MFLLINVLLDDICEKKGYSVGDGGQILSLVLTTTEACKAACQVIIIIIRNTADTADESLQIVSNS